MSDCEVSTTASYGSLFMTTLILSKHVPRHCKLCTLCIQGTWADERFIPNRCALNIAVAYIYIVCCFTTVHDVRNTHHSTVATCGEIFSRASDEGLARLYLPLSVLLRDLSIPQKQTVVNVSFVASENVSNPFGECALSITVTATNHSACIMVYSPFRHFIFFRSKDGNGECNLDKNLLGKGAQGVFIVPVWYEKCAQIRL